MTTEEFQKLVLEKLVSLEQRQQSLEQGQQSLEQGQKSLESKVGFIENNMATKKDIGRLEQRFDQLDNKLEKDVHEILKLTYDKIEAIDKKVDNIAITQDIQGESINILTIRQLQSESEFAVFRKAK
jgi:hypothetical protein